MVHLFKAMREIDQSHHLYNEIQATFKAIQENPKEKLVAFLESEMSEKISWQLESQRVAEELELKQRKEEEE